VKLNLTEFISHFLFQNLENPPKYQVRNDRFFWLYTNKF